MTPQRHIDQGMRGACESAAPQAGEGQRSGDQPGDGARADVDAWLDTVARLLPAGEADRASIREELESHVRDRVIDLMVLGHTEPEAVRLAVEEFGGAAELARSFRRAKRGFFRRHAMHISVLAVAGSALGLSLFAVTNPQAIPGGVPKRAQVFEAPAEEVVNEYADLRVNIPSGRYKLSELLAQVADQLGLDLDFRWYGDLAVKNATVEFEDAATTLGQIFEQSAGPRGIARDFRYWISDGELVVQPAPRPAAEPLLVSYDIGDLMTQEPGEGRVTGNGKADDADVAKRNEIAKTLYEHGEGAHAGDSYFSISAVGQRLFITAPREVHARIAWLLEQMAHDKESEQSEKARSQTAEAEHELRIIQMQHADADDVQDTLVIVFENSPGLSSTFHAIVDDDATNTIILNMPADLADRVEDLARRLDEIASQRESADVNGEGADLMRQQAIERRQRMLRQRQQREPN